MAAIFIAAVDAATGDYLYGGWRDEAALEADYAAALALVETLPLKERADARDRVEAKVAQARARLYDVEPGLSPGQVRIVLDREPDMRTERCQAGAIVAKPADAIAAFDAAVAEAQAKAPTIANLLARIAALEAKVGI